MQWAPGSQLFWVVSHAGVGLGDTAVFESFLPLPLTHSPVCNHNKAHGSPGWSLVVSLPCLSLTPYVGWIHGCSHLPRNTVRQHRGRSLDWVLALEFLVISCPSPHCCLDYLQGVGKERAMSHRTAVAVALVGNHWREGAWGTLLFHPEVEYSVCLTLVGAVVPGAKNRMGRISPYPSSRSIHSLTTLALIAWLKTGGRNVFSRGWSKCKERWTCLR